MAQSPEQQQEFLRILNGMLDLMSNLSEGDYLKGADMCRDIKEVVDNMRTNTVYIYMNRERQVGMTNQQKLSSGLYFTCPDCNLIVNKDEKCIKRHKKCKTHIRGVYMDKLIKKGYRKDEVDNFVKRKMFVLTINETYGCCQNLLWFCKKHNGVARETDKDQRQHIYEFYKVGNYRVPYYIEHKFTDN